MAKREGLATKLFYGFGSVAFGVKDQGFGVLLMLFYNQVLGLPAAMVGAAVGAALVIDAVADPIVGHVSDNWRSKWGRRHPFMYAAAIPASLAYLLLWNPPQGLSHEALFVYLLVTAIVVRTFITAFEIPSSALVAELTTNYDQRTSYLSLRFFFGWWGSLAMSIASFKIFLQPDATHPVGQLNPHGYSTYAIVASTVMFLAILITAIGTHGRIKTFRAPPEQRPFSLTRSVVELRQSLSNRAFLMMIGAGLFGAVAAGIGGTLVIYFRTYLFDLSAGQISFLLIGNFASAAAALVLAPILARRFGKKRVAITMALGSIFISPAPIFLSILGVLPTGGSQALVAILFAFTTVATTFTITWNILAASMIADVVEDSERVTGRRSEGLFFSANAFVLKSVTGVGLFVTGILLSFADFPAAAHPGPETHAAMTKLAFLEQPLIMVCYLISITFLAAYPITRRGHQANLEALGDGVDMTKATASAEKLGVDDNPAPQVA